MISISTQTLLAGIDAVGWTLLHFLWQGAAIGLAYRVLQPLARSVTARYRLGMGFLIALFACPLLTLAYFWPQHAARAAAAAMALDPVAVTASSASAVAGAGFEALLPWLVAAWFVGATLIAIRAFAHWRRLAWLVRHAAIPLPDCAEVLAKLCRRFGVSQQVRLLGSMGIDTPMLVGWLRPVILLPISMLSGFTPQQVELIIAHELGHVRRWDYLANLLQVIIETVLFYHPVVHWISRDVRDARESCCDDLVLALAEGSPVVYANTLADLEQMRHDGALAAPALAASGGVLLDRIRRIVGAQNVLYDPLPRSGAWPILLIAGLGMLAALRLHAPAPNAAATWLRSPIEKVMPVEQPTHADAVSAVATSALATVQSVVSPATERAAAPPPKQSSTAVPEPEVSAPVAITPVGRPRISLAAISPEVPTRFADLRERIASLPALPAADTLPAAKAPDAPVALQRVQPEYPLREKIRGVTGNVELQFAIDSDGSVGDVTVLASTADHVFDRVAIAALKQWRFASPRSPGNRYTQNFAFTLGAPAAATEPCREVIGSHICRHMAAGDETEH